MLNSIWFIGGTGTFVCFLGFLKNNAKIWKQYFGILNFAIQIRDESFETWPSAFCYKRKTVH